MTRWTKPRTVTPAERAHVDRVLVETADRRASAAAEDAEMAAADRPADDDHRSDSRDHLR